MSSEMTEDALYPLSCQIVSLFRSAFCKIEAHDPDATRALRFSLDRVHT
jgi:hypothetical protein